MTVGGISRHEFDSENTSLLYVFIYFNGHMLANLSCDPSSLTSETFPPSPQRPGRDLRRPPGLAPPVLRRLGAACAASHRRAADPGEQLQPAGQRRSPAAALQDPGRPQGPGGESCVDLTLRHSVVEEDTINLKKPCVF